MKRTLLFAAFLTGSISVTISQNVTIPDANFKTYLLGNTAINTNSDAEIQVSEAIAYTGGIYCNNLNISDFTGLEAFTNISDLLVEGNGLTSIDVSMNTQLTNLSVKNNSLTTFDVTNNTLLNGLDCSNNNLTSLDLSNKTALVALWCQQNLLTNINLDNTPVLSQLYCNSNNLVGLDLSNNGALTVLWVHNNSLTSLSVANGNSSGFTQFSAFGNNNLDCIEIDDADTTGYSWSPGSFDAGVTFSNDCGSLGLENTTSTLINIYPNPASEEIKITLNTPEEVYLMNLNGTIISTSGRAIGHQLNLSSLDAGVYIVHTESGKTKLFIKQ